MTVNSCGNCTFWEVQTAYSDGSGDGKCTKIAEKARAEVVYGWEGGYIEMYVTESDFGCNLHKEKTPQ